MRMRFFMVAALLAKGRGLLLFVVPLLGCAYGSAQFSVGHSQTTGEKHTLTGTAVNSFTGEPVPYALVQVGERAKLSDQNGNFSFDDLPYTAAAIIAHKPGFFNEQEIEAGNMRGGQPQTVTLSDKPTSVTVRLIPEAVLSGHVENAEGEPLEGLPVRLRGSQVVNGRRVLQNVTGTATDEDGNFRIANLKPGTFYVVVGPNFRARPLQQEQDAKQKFEVVPAEYYPGVREISAASPVRLNPGQHASIELGMKRVPAFRVAGALTGAATANGGLELLDPEGEQTSMGFRFDGKTGRFEAFPIPAGAYRLRFNGQDENGRQLFADVSININGDIPELRIPVERTIDVPVEFRTEFTKQDATGQSGVGGLAGGGRGTIGLSENVGQIYAQIHLVQRKPPYQQHYPNREKPDGPITFRGLEPGTYDVEADPNGSARYISSITCGGVNLLSDPLVIAEGADPQPIQVTVRDDSASIEGSVQIPDGKHFVNVLMIAEGTGSTPRSIPVGNAGKFQIGGLAPGNYDILAFDRLDGIEYHNRDALNEYLSHASHVTLSPEQKAQVTVDLIHTKE